MTNAQEKFIADLLDSVTISQDLKDSIREGIDLKKISVNEASRLIKALIELDFNYLVAKYLSGEEG